jgi:exosortase D (VPLPA-CTERM-specific)
VFSLNALARNRYVSVLLGLLVIGLLGVTYRESLGFLFQVWMTDENYGYGPLIPFISGYLVWIQRSDLLKHARDGGSWWGLLLVLGGAALFIIGEAAALFFLAHLSFWSVLIGSLIMVIGVRGATSIAFPLLYLLFAIPLPAFLQGDLSTQLQLLSSALGVGCLKLIGVMAYRDGNVIDLGPIQLQVVEACSGIRFLFPLLALASLCAYLYRERWWKRIVVCLSSVPIAIILNGLRIGAIGILVELKGPEAAKGFAHLFEGWVFFVVSLALLIWIMWLLAGKSSAGVRRSWAELLIMPSSPRSPILDEHVSAGANFPKVLLPKMLCTCGILVLLAIGSTVDASRGDAAPARQSLIDFPLELENWHGEPFAMEKQYLDALKLDDYVLANYQAATLPPVNFYVAYYSVPIKGRSAHSPKTCIPGDGWEISSFETVTILSGVGDQPLPVNRVLIHKGGQRQIVYYWFKQRDRLLTNEYLVKFFYFWDSLTRGRTDGALVRLVSPVLPQEGEAGVDRRLEEVAKLVTPRLSQYVPD